MEKKEINSNNIVNRNDNKLNIEHFKEKLIEEGYIKIQNNLQFLLDRYEQILDNCIKQHYDKITKPYSEKNPENEKKIIEKNKFCTNYSTQINLAISKELEDEFKKDAEDLKEGINKLLDTDNINDHCKIVYQNIQNNEYSIDKINEKAKLQVENFEKIHKDYLLTKTKYKEEKEINKNREEKLKKGINIKQDYEDINNYLDNYNIDGNYEENYDFFQQYVQKNA